MKIVMFTSQQRLYCVVLVLFFIAPVQAMVPRYASAESRVEALWTRFLEGVESAVCQQQVGYCDVVPAGKMVRDVVSESSEHMTRKVDDIVTCARELWLCGSWVMPSKISENLQLARNWFNFTNCTPLEIIAACGSISLCDKFALCLPARGIGQPYGSYFDFENSCLRLGFMPDEAAERCVSYDHPAFLEADCQRPGNLLNVVVSFRRARIFCWLVMLGARPRSAEHAEQLLQVFEGYDAWIVREIMRQSWKTSTVLPPSIAECANERVQEPLRSQEWWQQYFAQLQSSKPTEQEIQAFLDKQAAITQ